MEKLKVLIVEDEPLIAESLADILELLDHEVTGSVSNGEDLLKTLSKSKPDLILLDIQLKGSLSGLELAPLLNQQYKVPYIFTTAFADDETIEQAQENSPYGYVVKPYGINDIKAAIAVALGQMQKQAESSQKQYEVSNSTNGQLFLKCNNRLVRVQESDVLYVEAKGDFALFKTANEGLIVSSTMKRLANRLNPEIFFQAHRSYIINLNHIEDIEDNSVEINGKVIPVSKNQKQRLLERLNTI